MDTYSHDRSGAAEAGSRFGDPPRPEIDRTDVPDRHPQVAPDNLSTLASSGRSVRLFTAPGFPDRFEATPDLGPTPSTSLGLTSDR